MKSDKHLLSQVMSFVLKEKELPAPLTKELMATMILYRARSKWLEDLIVEMLSILNESTDKLENMTGQIHGAFSEEDDVFLDSYLECTNRKLADEAFSKDRLVYVKGGKPDQEKK